MIFPFPLPFPFNTVVIFLLDLVGLYLAFLVYWSHRSKNMNRGFALMVTSILAWVNFYYFAQYVNPTFWFRLSGSAVFIFFIAYYFFTVRWFLEKQAWYKALGLVILIYGILLAATTAFTDTIIPNSQNIVSYVARPDFSPIGWWLFYGFAVCVTLFINWALIKEYSVYSSERRVKVAYFLVGLLIFAVLNIIFNVVLPVFFNVYNYYELGNYSAIFLLAFSAFAIVRQELFGIKVVLTQTLVIAIDILLLWQTIVALPNWLEVSWKAVLFGLFVMFGVFLVSSVKKEIKQREQIEKLAKEVQRSYELEKKAYEVEKQARLELENLDKTKNQFLLLIQHNLRTPLTSMMGYSDLLLTGTFGKLTKKTADVVGKLQTATKNMIGMVNDFLDITQFQLGKDVLTTKPGVALAPILDEIVAELKEKAEAKHIALTFEKPAQECVITADRGKLKAALINIIDNSIKYTPTGGVTVNLQNRGMVLITVKDTGIGISAEQLKNLFNRLFERSEAAKKTAATGSGIGLYLAAQIIKYHGGKIWAESAGEGKGSTFFIELPQSSPIESLATASAQSTQKPIDLSL